MFTGIIEATANVISTSDHQLVIERPKIFDDLKIGASISISGVCLTITSFDDRSMTFDVMPITLEKTTLGSLKKDHQVNLERSLQYGDRLDGHIVQGHCEGVGTVKSIEKKNDDTRMTIDIPKNLMQYIVAEAPIAIDGVSLTIASIESESSITIGVIPHTLSTTIIHTYKEGDTVNIETDILWKYMTKHHEANKRKQDTI